MAADQPPSGRLSLPPFTGRLLGPYYCPPAIGRLPLTAYSPPATGRLRLAACYRQPTTRRLRLTAYCPPSKNGCLVLGRLLLGGGVVLCCIRLCHVVMPEHTGHGHEHMPPREERQTPAGPRQMRILETSRWAARRRNHCRWGMSGLLKAMLKRLIHVSAHVRGSGSLAHPPGRGRALSKARLRLTVCVWRWCWRRTCPMAILA